MVSYDLVGSQMIRQVVQMIQSISSTLITVTYILKAMCVVLSLYLSLNAPFKMTIFVYHMICQSNKYMDT